MTLSLLRRGTRPARSGTSVLITASLVSSMIMLDSNIVAVSLPAIARSLNATFADVEWVISAYVLAFAALLLAAGAFADLRGRRFATLLGLGIFMVASGLCGLATSAAMLNWARALQGVGASLLLTSALAVINHAFHGADRGRAYAVWGSCLGVAITCGPIVGGVITDWLGWRWAFLVNVPACLALLLATAAFIEESRDPGAERLDIFGVVTFSAGLLLLTWALIEGNALGWGSLTVVWRLAGAAVLLIGFVVVEARQVRPMVDLALFTRPDFLGAAVAMVGYAVGAHVLIFYVPLYLQTAYALSTTLAGLGMLPFALPMFLAPRFGTRFFRGWSDRRLLVVGLGVTCVGDLIMALLAASGAGYPAFAGAMLVAGAGAGLLNGETARVLQGTVPPDRAGMASGLSATTRFTGLLLGVAGLGAILSHQTAKAFAAGVAPLGLSGDLATALARRLTAGDMAGVTASVPDGSRVLVDGIARHAFSQGFHAATLLAASVAAVSAVAAACLVDARGEERAAAPDLDASDRAHRRAEIVVAE